MYSHNGNHKLTCFSTGVATVIMKEICVDKQATSAYTNMFNVFDNSCCWKSHTWISGLASFSKLKYTTSGSNLGNSLAFYKKPDIDSIYSDKPVQLNLIV